MHFKQYIFGVFLILLWVGIALFSYKKNMERSLGEVSVKLSGTPVFLGDSLVNKLLIQNLSKEKKQSILEVDLNMVETLVQSNPYVQNAEIYPLTPRHLAIEVEERVAVLRIFGQENYYIDSDLHRFPSRASSASLVPIFYGNPDSTQLAGARKIQQTLDAHPALKDRLTHMEVTKTGGYSIALRKMPFQIHLGKPTSLHLKCEKIKLFEAYQAQVKDSIVFKQIRLDFSNQIVAIPKNL